uniref:phosphatidylinositol 3-kinase n=1 Tax=Globisporangium ultimum (strain ATCC 200006 / CBS 805.95 / DAOM BR144) TaxID=431595 RepID=K3WGK4_GLOUD
MSEMVEMVGVVDPQRLTLAIEGCSWNALEPIDEARESVEIRSVEGVDDNGDAPGADDKHQVKSPTKPNGVKENKWKLAFRQLMFMKRMNMQFNDRNKNEIELRQQNITPLSLMCSIPYFNALTPEEITALVDASQRESMRPGESMSLSCSDPSQDARFYIIISGNLSLTRHNVDNASAVRQAELMPSMKLGIGDYFATHASSDMKVIAMELVEFLVVPMQVISKLSLALSQQIQAETNDSACDASETESYKQWALQFSLANRKCEFPSAEPGGLAKCSVKTFCKDHFPHVSPENELDHTLEYVKGALMSIFSARKIRVYGVDEANDRLVIKFSDERLPKSYVGMKNTIAKRILHQRRPIFVASGAEICNDESDVLASTLYHEDDMVLAAPFFEYHPLGVHRATSEPAKIVGILEVVITRHCEEVQDGKVTKLADPVVTENDMCILELTAQELGRYLYFHYNEFFQVPHAAAETNIRSEGIERPEARSEGEDSDEPVTEVFPTPDVHAGEDARKLVVNISNLEISYPGAISHADVCIQLGKMPLITRKIQISCPKSPSKDKSSSQSPRKCSFEFPGTDMGLSLSNIPHGSHLRIILKTKSGPIAWTGVHLFDFGHALRTGPMELDLRSMPVAGGVITPLDVENCLKRDRPSKASVLGKLGLIVECSGRSPQIFAFSSIAKKRSITFRASIFYNPVDSSVIESYREMDPMGSLVASRQKFLLQVRKDPLMTLSAEDRKFIWDSRLSLIGEPELLPTFLLSVDWSHREQVMEAYRLLILWQPPTYLQALQLLSPLFPDPKVRAYAVRCMHALPDHRLRLYLLQLVQVLKNERYHDSALARFLLMRGLMNPSQIGYLLYWYLKAEAHMDQTTERFELIMSLYLELCGSYKLELRQSVYVMKKLEEIAAVVKIESSQTSRKEKLHEELKRAILPETFQIPLHPRTFYSGFIVDKCRVMESKKRPLFLQLENTKAQHGRPYVIFKSGDDLRQDQLVLQILRVMDDLWREAGLELCLIPYACISTGDEIGMIEVVAESETLASIIYGRHENSRTKLSRKLKSARDALMQDGVMSDWLFEQQPLSPGGIDAPTGIGNAETAPPDVQLPPIDVQKNPIELQQDPPSLSKSDPAPSVSACFPLSPSKLLRGMSRKSVTPPPRDEEVTQNFIRSCAGYCVATYVLGIGDRHNDNLMLQRSGKFFHIDFGHFLGNFKSKAGVKRERAPFVFTPSMLDVIGGKSSENYQTFKKLACDAFRVLRAHSNLLITLLVLALTCGIPELASSEHIKWVHKTLMIELSDEEAEQRFKKLINVALNTKTTQINDAIHLMAH